MCVHIQRDSLTVSKNLATLNLCVPVDFPNAVCQCWLILNNIIEGKITSYWIDPFRQFIHCHIVLFLEMVMY